MRSDWLPIPDFFDEARVAEVWRVPYQQRAAEAYAWAARHGIRPAAADRVRLCLVLVDVQNTFCIPGFELFVGGRSGMGAVEDCARLCRFIYHNLHLITNISATMDTHYAPQIFHEVFWVNAEGQHPQPYATITVADVEQRKWWVNPAIARLYGKGDLDYVQQHALHYVRSLAAGGKYELTIWPYHAMLGGIGHALVSAVEEACFFHSCARVTHTDYEIKGQHALTENYSVLRPEVLTDADGKPIADKNTAFVQKLLGYDMVVLAGEAKSHCVAWTIEDLVQEIGGDRALARKVYLLDDCATPVVVPGVADYSEQADAAFQRAAAAGMHIVRSDEPIAQWPDTPF